MQKIKISSETLDQMWDELAEEAISNSKGPTKIDALKEFNSMIERMHGFRIEDIYAVTRGQTSCIVTNPRLAVEFILKGK